MSICCPSCGSLRVVARNQGRKIGGAVGAVGGTASGAAGAMAGAQSGALIGAFAGPIGITIGSLAGAILGGLAGGTAGGLAGAKMVRSSTHMYSTTMSVITAVFLFRKQNIDSVLPLVIGRYYICFFSKEISWLIS